MPYYQVSLKMIPGTQCVLKFKNVELLAYPYILFDNILIDSRTWLKVDDELPQLHLDLGEVGSKASCKQA